MVGGNQQFYLTIMPVILLKRRLLGSNNAKFLEHIKLLTSVADVTIQAN